MSAPEPVRGRPRKTALAIVVAEAQALVDGFRRRFHAASVAKAIPPHATLLYPFVDAEQVDDDLLSSLVDFYGGLQPFDFELARVARFDAHVWLAPEPRARFVDLIDRTCVRFPEHPLYGGEHDATEPTPHLTIGDAAGGADVAAMAAAAEKELDGRLPLRCAARAVSLLEEQPDGRWAERFRVPLGGR